MLFALGVVLLAVAFLGYVFHTMRTEQDYIEKLWDRLEDHLGQRHSIIPEIVNTATAADVVEAATVKDLASLHAKAMRAEAPEDRAVAETRLDTALRRFIDQIETHDEIMRSQAYQEQRRKLHRVSDDIAALRTAYNQAAWDYAQDLDSYPGRLVMWLPQMDIAYGYFAVGE